MLGNGITAGQSASIRNGTVRRMGRDGIEVGAGSIIENVTVAENAFDTRVLQQCIHQNRFAADRQDVDVATGLAAATHTADGNEVHSRSLLLEVGNEIG